MRGLIIWTSSMKPPLTKRTVRIMANAKISKLVSATHPRISSETITTKKVPRTGPTTVPMPPRMSMRQIFPISSSPAMLGSTMLKK